MKRKSRFEQISRKRYQRNIILIFVGIIILLIVFFVNAVPLLINLSLFIENFRNDDNKNVITNNTSYIPPPVIDPLPNATNSANIIIKGTALPKQIIKLYINNTYTKQAAVAGDRTFVFKNVSLSKEDNNIKAKSIAVDKKESGYSQIIHIVYKNKAPQLTINTPTDKQIITDGGSQTKIEGKTDTGVQVTVNDHWAIVDNTGNFSYLLNLQKGENKINVIASDDAGNQTTSEIHVTLNQ